MIRQYGLILSLLAGTVSACPDAGDTRPALPQRVLEQLAANDDVKQYVCAEAASCTAQELGEGLAASGLRLKPAAAADDALLVEPTRKGRQFFSAIFVDGDNARMVFGPDVSMTGVRVLPRVRNGYYMLRSVSRDSTVEWDEYDFAYDTAKQQYWPAGRKCYAQVQGKAKARKCR